MAAAPEREEESVFELRVSLKIAGNEIDIAVLLRRNSELVERAVQGALEVVTGLLVGNIAPGSIIVELLCTTRESFLAFMEDFEAKKVKQRLNEEFRKIGHNEELEVTIANGREVYKELEQIRNTIQGFGATEKRDLAIPLCLPNNWNWDPQTGKCIKVEDRRSTLYVNEEALTQLRKIKGPVCVVSIAGTCRMGKSFVLSEAFNQPDVFPLGHEMDPETVGIWLWIVPEKYEDSNGREFTLVLLDSEGIDSAASEGFDDHQIFTLTVLLASVVIFNSALVPKRHDLEQLGFIAKLSQRIQILSNSGSAVQTDESELYQKIFPYFVWLLRDVTLSVPSDCNDLRDYFFKKVFKEPDSSAASRESKDVAESILRFFSGFKPFTLPPPTDKSEIMRNLKKNKLQTNSSFWSGLEEFKLMLKPILTPKHSVNDGEFVTGEALAALVQLYIKEINTPDAIPNVQNAWDIFVKDKCFVAKRAALVTYDALLTSRLSDVLPCDNDTIRVSHNAALEECEEQFMAEVNGFSTNKVELHLRELKVATKERLTSWLTENETKTKQDCKDLLAKLKKRHLDPVLQQLKAKSGAKQVSYADIIAGYKKMEEEYKNSAKGAKDAIAEVFAEFHPELMKEKEQNLSLLRQLKDFDEEMDKVLAAKAVIDQERKRLEEQHARLQQQIIEQKKQMELLIKNQEEEKKRVHEHWQEEIKKQKDQLQNMIATNMKKAEDERRDFIARNDEMRDRLMVTQQKNENNLTRIKNLSDRVATEEKEKQKADRELKTFRDEMKAKMHEAEKKSAEHHRMDMEELMKTNAEIMKTLSDQAADKEKEMAEELYREELRKIRNEMTAANPHITDRIDDIENRVERIAAVNKEKREVEKPGFVDFVTSIMPIAAGAALTTVVPPFVLPVVATVTAFASKCSIM